jgi:hypothetical protein
MLLGFSLHRVFLLFEFVGKSFPETFKHEEYGGVRVAGTLRRSHVQVMSRPLEAASVLEVVASARVPRMSEATNPASPAAAASDSP